MSPLNLTPPQPPWLDRMEKKMEPLLGGFTAKMALKTAALRTFNRAPETLVPSDAPQLIEALKPMLNTLVGSLHTKIIVEQLNTDLEKR